MEKRFIVQQRTLKVRRVFALRTIRAITKMGLRVKHEKQCKVTTVGTGLSIEVRFFFVPQAIFFHFATLRQMTLARTHECIPHTHASVRVSFVCLCGSHLSISAEVIRQSVRRSFFNRCDGEVKRLKS